MDDSTIVFCCYNCLDLPWEKFFQEWVTCLPSSWEQEHCVEKRLCKFMAKGREFVTFLGHCSCLRELGRKVSKGNLEKLFSWPDLNNYRKRILFPYFIFVFHEILYFSRLWIKDIPQGHLIKKFMLGLQISMITHQSLIGKSTKSVWMKVCQSTLLFWGKKCF